MPESNATSKSNPQVVHAAQRSNFSPRTVGGVCEHCDWKFIFEAAEEVPTCPHCFEAKITIYSSMEDLSVLAVPELVIPHALSTSSLELAIRKFSTGIPFPGKDLNTKTLLARLKRVYFPSWLVDGDVSATWHGEIGYDYTVASHIDSYSDSQGNWVSREVEENRIRWEPRVGRLSRRYENILCGALNISKNAELNIRDQDLGNSNRFAPDFLKDTFCRLPDRDQNDAWADGTLAFLLQAREECRLACNGNHVRNYQWKPEFSDLNWTLLLHPIYTTYYTDDQNKIQRLVIHGQNGTISGRRLASMQQAQAKSLNILIVASLLFLMSLILGAASILLPAIFILAVLVGIVSIVTAILTVWPIFKVWQFNRNQD